MSEKKKQSPQPARFVRMFKRQFADLVESGQKLQTVRPTPTRMPKVGDEIDLREWTDKPYRSKQRQLGIGKIVDVREITITEERVEISAWSRFIRCPDSEEFARLDGFASFQEMKAWFQKQHGLPFTGILMRWELLKEKKCGNSPSPDVKLCKITGKWRRGWCLGCERHGEPNLWTVPE